MGRGRCRGNHRPVAAIDGQVEVTLSHADHPLADRSARYAVNASNLRQGDPLGHIGQCTEDIAHVVDLARQDIAGKNPLPGLSVPATSHPYFELPVARTAIQTARHPDIGQMEVDPTAFAAAAARKNIV